MGIDKPLEEQVSELKFFIHDLRIDRFFLNLMDIHRKLVDFYDKAGLDESKARHLDYIDRLQRRRDKAYDARMSYEIAVNSRQPEDVILKTGREYIDATLETCRIALLPHWRNFETFLLGLPNETAARKLESEFHELKIWIAATDRRIMDFIRSLDEEPPMGPVQLDQLVQSYVETTLRSYVRSASDDRHNIRVGKLEPGLIWAEEGRFRRLLFNLVMNAVDAMRERPKGHIRVSVEVSELTASVIVGDEGVGMPAEKVDQILHSDHDLRGELHSLGFRFVRQTVDAFNGKIYVDSSVGVGTTVRIDFSRYIPEEAEAATRPTSADEAAEQESETPRATKDLSARAGSVIVDDYCRSLSPLPGCLFSISIASDGEVDHFAHKAYDPDWMMGHEDLAPMLYRSVFRGRYETDDRYGTAVILKAPHSYEDYWQLRDTPEEERTEEQACRMLHDEYVRIARTLIESGMDPNTVIYITHKESCFETFGQSFSADPFPLRELADKPTL